MEKNATKCLGRFFELHINTVDVCEDTLPVGRVAHLNHVVDVQERDHIGPLLGHSERQLKVEASVRGIERPVVEGVGQKVVQQRTERQPIRPRRRKVVDGHIGVGERAIAAPADESLASCGGRSRPVRLALEWRLGRSDRITCPQRWVTAIETKIQLANTLPIILNCVIG